MGLKVKRGLSLNLTIVISLVIILGLASFVFAAVVKISPVSISPSNESSIKTQTPTSSISSVQSIVKALPTKKLLPIVKPLPIPGNSINSINLNIQIPISSCAIINSSGTYVLTTNILNSASSCINITASNVIFDGAGYTIDGIDTSSYGVYVYNSSTILNNVTVKNLVVTDWGVGIFYQNTQNGSIANNTASSNTNLGIYLYSSSNYNTLTNNTVSLNWIGIRLESSSNNNILIGNTANSNSLYGIILSSSSSNTLINNNASSNGDAGVRIEFSSSNNLTSNILNSNTYNGIILFSSSNYNTLINNTASSNIHYGIRLSSSSNNNALTRNTAASNGEYGIYLQASSSSNTIANNTASSNGIGIFLTSSNSNLIFNNFFNNTINARDNGVNAWNTTKTSGTNIIGGPYLGGNFWSDYAGVDNNGDGLGDTNLPYKSENNITNGGDYLPLVNFIPLICGDINGNGAVTSSDIVYLQQHLYLGGPAPVNFLYGDINADGVIDAFDIAFLPPYIFQGGSLTCGPKGTVNSTATIILDAPSELQGNFTFPIRGVFNNPAAVYQVEISYDSSQFVPVSSYPASDLEVSLPSPGKATYGRMAFSGPVFNGSVNLTVAIFRNITANYNLDSIRITKAEAADSTGRKFNNVSFVNPLPQQPFSLYEPYSLLPTEKIETGILIDIGSILHTHLVERANGIIPEVNAICGDLSGDGVHDVVDVVKMTDIAFRGKNETGSSWVYDVDSSGAVDIVDVVKIINVAFRGKDPATEFNCTFNINEDSYLSAGQFMEAYGDLERGSVQGGLIPKGQVLSKSAQNFSMDGIYPIALAAINYNSIDKSAVNHGLLELRYKNGTVFVPSNETSENDSGELTYFVETEQGQTNSYLNTSLFFGVGSISEVVYGDDSNIMKLIIPSELLITDNTTTVENMSIRFIGLPNQNVSDAEFIPIDVDRIFAWDMSKAIAFNETDNSSLESANITFIIRATVGGAIRYTAGQFTFATNPLRGYKHCSPIELKAEYPIAKPYWWNQTAWDNKPSNPVIFFSGSRPSWWENSIPWPTPLSIYPLYQGLNPFGSMGLTGIIHDPQVWGPLYDSQTGVVSQNGTEGGTNWRGGYKTRLYLSPRRPFNPLDCKAVNLVVIMDGFDVKNARTIETVEAAFIGAIKPMLDKGYDVLILDYNNNHEGGRDYIQRNGYALMEVLKNIPSTYMKTGYEDNDAIVAGGSMGTQTTRYALAKAEDLGIDHNTGLWIVVDGPFVGAHIPWSLQAFINFFSPISIGAEELKEGLDSPASKQMLRRGMNLKPDNLYVSYYKEVNALNGGRGLPSKVRTVTISSGSGSGASTAGYQTGGSRGAQFAYVDELSAETLWYGVEINARTENAGDVFYGKVKKPKYFDDFGIPHGYSFKQEWTWHINSGNQDIDFSPGGYRTSPQEAVDEYNKMVVPKGSQGLHINMVSPFKVHDFMTTFSSLYYRGADSSSQSSLNFWKEEQIQGKNTPTSLSTLQNVTNLWYGPEDPILYPANCGKSSCMDPDIEQKSPFDAIWYEFTNTQHVVVNGERPTIGSYNFMFNELDKFTSQEEFSSRLLGNSPKEPMHEVFLIGNISGCGQELLTINTFTEKAMVQKFVNNQWIILWQGQTFIGGWNINKGDKFFLENIDGNKASELISLSNSVPANAKVQRLVPNVPCSNNPTSYSWQEVWNNNGSGYLGPWKIQYTDLYSYGDVVEPDGSELLYHNKELLVAYPYAGNNVRERDYPGAGGRSKASLLEFSPIDGWQEIWNNNGNLHWIGNRTSNTTFRGCPIRFGDHMEFGKVFNNSLNTLLCTNLIPDLFGSSIYKDQIVMQNFDNTWKLNWTNATKIGSWSLGGPEDSYHFADLDGDGVDELLSINTTFEMIQKFNTSASKWDLVEQTSISELLTLGYYSTAPGDRFIIGNIDNEPSEEIITLNPMTKGAVMIQRLTPSQAPGWVTIYNDYNLGNWVLYES